MIALVDTNLFKRLTKNREGIHDHFIAGLGDAASSLDWRNTHFGLLEYLGLALRGAAAIPDMPQHWQPEQMVLDRYKAVVDSLGQEYVRHVYWVRSHATNYYKGLVSSEHLNTAAERERQYHSKEFRDGPLSELLFDLPLSAWDSNDVAELLAIDFLHRYDGFPTEIAEKSRRLNRTTMLAEYYQERRNIILFRGFKGAWNNRPVSPSEAQVSGETMERLNRAISRLKNGQDRFDHDLLGFFLLGYFDGQAYRPVRIFTQDDPSELLHRLVVFWSIVEFTWKEWSDLEGVGPVPFQEHAVFSFVNDQGDVTQNITYVDLLRFLIQENLVEK